MKKTLGCLKQRVQDFKINFKKKFKEYKKKPKSKRKSFIVGFTAAVGIFGLTLFGPALSAFAKDIPKGNPKPTDLAPAPVQSIPPSSEIINADENRSCFCHRSADKLYGQRRRLKQKQFNDRYRFIFQTK